MAPMGPLPEMAICQPVGGFPIGRETKGYLPVTGSVMNPPLIAYSPGKQ